MKSGTRHSASQAAGASRTGNQSGGRLSKARAPCQQQPNAAIRDATPMPIARKSPVKPRNRNSNAARLPQKYVALHHANQSAPRLSLSQKMKNKTPSTSLMKSPKSRMVKASICMFGSLCNFGVAQRPYSHSIVPGGFDVTS